MFNYTFKQDHRLRKQWVEISNFYQRSFSLALLNWEINRQEERLESQKTRVRK